MTILPKMMDACCKGKTKSTCRLQIALRRKEVCQMANVSRGQPRIENTRNHRIWLSVILALSSCSLAHAQDRPSARTDRPSSRELETGIALAQKGDLAGAEESFERAVMLHPGDAQALTALGQVQEQRGKLSDSIATFHKVIGLDPGSADAHVNLGIALGDHSELAAALQESITAIHLAPNSADANFLRGRLLSDLGKPDDARNEFRKVLKIAPRFAEALYYWAALEGDVGNKVDQGNLLRRYLNLRPENATAWFQLGQILQEEHRDSEAIAAWKRATALNPNYSAALYSLGRALKGTDPAESKRLVERCKELESDRQTIDQVNMLGNQANQKMYDANYKGAIDDLKNAIVLCGRCELLGALEKNIGLAYCHAGQLGAGERELEIAETLIPEDPSVKEALQTVKQQRSQIPDRH
jgi:tetratricopeptide (TPR) repeat protein